MEGKTQAEQGLDRIDIFLVERTQPWAFAESPLESEKLDQMCYSHPEEKIFCPRISGPKSKDPAGMGLSPYLKTFSPGKGEERYMAPDSIE